MSDIDECSGDLRMAPSPLDKQPAGYKSPHDWMVRLGMAFGCYQFTWTINSPCIDSHRPSLSTPIAMLVIIFGIASKKLSKMAGNSVSYSFNSYCIYRL